MRSFGKRLLARARNHAWSLTALALVPVQFLAAIYFAPVAPLQDIPTGSLVLDSRGRMMRINTASDGQYRLPTRLDNLPPYVAESLIAYEDRYFYQHPGVNIFALLRGALSLFGGRRQGGSTIAMQVARLRYKLATNTIGGKLRQICYALHLSMRHTRPEILTAYFHLAPYGGNVAGIEAASWIYFHKSASALTPLEAQALALVPQNPVARAPGKPAFQAALKKLVGESRPLAIYSQGQLPFRAPHVSMELGASPGIHHSTIEADLQAMIERVLVGFAARGKREGLANSAALLLRPGDMSIVALAGSANFHDVSISGQIDGTSARRSPGSTLKPFIYALALDQGLIHPGTILQDSPRSFAGYDPENFDRAFRGPLPAHEALKTSRNLPAIQLAQKLATPGLYGFLQKAGMDFPHGPRHYGLALVLGGAEISMRQLASLYAMLANRGLWQPAKMEKNAILPPPIQLLSPAACWLVLEMLNNPDEPGIFYKTGTSNGLRDAWTAGLVGEYVLIVWVGNFDNRANPRLVGADTALPIFREIAQNLQGMRNLGDPLEQMPKSVAAVDICAETGDIFQGQCGFPVKGHIIPGVTSMRASGIARKILIDRETGLRACEPGNTEEVWFEFWPSDMRDLFANAGIHKPLPPEFLPSCRKIPGERNLQIVLPRARVTYHRRMGDATFSLPLKAACDAEIRQIHWYDGKRYIGSTPPGEILQYRADPGMHRIIAVADTGQSVTRKCEVQLLP